MNHTKLVCYRGVNDNKTPLTPQLIKDKSSKAGLYLASLIIKNTPELGRYSINANNMVNFTPDNELCTPFTCYAEVDKISTKNISISTTLYAGIDEQLIARTTTTIRCSEGNILVPYTVAGITVKKAKIEIDELVKKYSLLNMDMLFKAYLTYCNINNNPFSKPELSKFEYRAVKNFLSFANTTTGQIYNHYDPTLTIEQNMLLKEGNDFLTDTFCLNQ